MLRVKLFVFLLALCIASAPAAAKDKNSPAKAAARIVDSGSFTVFVNGQPIATESFQIQQRPDLSVATSEVKSADAKVAQRAELQVAPNGDLRRYEWRQTSPDRSAAVVQPTDQFLVERVTAADGKVGEKPFLLPTSTPVLDDYFFSHRQILVWRFLAQACGMNLDNCRPEKTQFGVLIPHQQASAQVTVEYAGIEKVNLRGTEHQLHRFNINTEDVRWALWMELSGFKVVRMTADNSEILRD